jgi:eukaryotic-like serine/threonine-protein kinase
LKTNGSAIRRFGTFEVDLRTGELRKAGVRLAIQDQPFRVLARLLEHPGELVTRDELRRELWPADTFVDFDHGLNVAIKRLRDVLGDTAESSRFIETLPRRGYRFIAPVVVPEVANTVHASVPEARAPKRRTFTRVLAGLSLLAIIGVSIAVVASRRSAPPGVGGSILIADFTNTTGDAAFDDSLQQGLIVHIGQSPEFSIVSPEQVREGLKRMTRPVDERIIGTVARELCQRIGANVAINGSIAPLGRHYAIALAAIACSSGATVGIEQTEAVDREHVLSALGTSATRLRRRLGESIDSLRRFNQPLEQATTSSIEALKAFTLGEDAWLRTFDQKTAIALYTRAIELDPDFAMAYARLSATASNLGKREDEIRYAREAFARRRRASEPERFYIDVRQCVAEVGTAFDGDCYVRIHEVWKRTYPRDWSPYTNLAGSYVSRGLYGKAIENGLEAIRLNPDKGFGYAHVVNAYMGLDQFADAARVIDAAIARRVFEDALRYERFQLAFIANDEAAMDAVRRAASGTRTDAEIIWLQSEAAAFQGRMRESRRLRTQTGRLMMDLDLGSPWRLELLITGSLIDAAVGLAHDVPASPESMDGLSRFRFAVAEALAGNYQRARTLLNDEKPTPDSGGLLRAARAFLDVETGQIDASRQLPTGLSDALPGAFGHLVPYLQGLTCLHAGEARKAAAEFQSIVDRRGVDATSVLYPLAYVQRGRALARSGDFPAARQSYESFFEIWRHADADVPILKQARTEYARLVNRH